MTVPLPLIGKQWSTLITKRPEEIRFGSYRLHLSVSINAFADSEALEPTSETETIGDCEGIPKYLSTLRIRFRIDSSCSLLTRSI